MDEPDETISVAGTLTDVVVTGTTITIEDNDATPTVTLALTPATINESGATNASTVTATMDGLSSEPVTLTVSATPVMPAVAADFTLSADTALTIPALSLAGTGSVTLTAVDNDVDAVDKTVTVSATASGGNGVAAPASRTLTITDDDTRGISVAKTALTLSEEDDTTSTSVSEHQDTYSVVLTSEPAGGTVTITVTSGDTTIAGVSPRSLVFGATDWNTPKTVTVTAVADTADNPMDRRIATITHTVSAAGSDYADETARGVTVTVNDDDGAPTLSINNPTVTEGDSATAALSFTVRLTPASGRQVTVAYGDQGTGTARAGTDYTALAAGTLTFAPGDTSKTVAVTVTGDVIDEPDETVVVRLSSPANATLTGGETTLDGTGTVEDNDPTPTLSVAGAAAVTEGDVATPDPPNNMTFTVQLSAASGRLVTVPYTLGGSATAGADYTAPNPLSVTIAPGSTEANITIPVKGDHVDEGNETVTVTLGTPTHATVSTAADAGTATGTITDDDTRGITVSAALTGVTVAEADDPETMEDAENEATYTVVLDSQPTGTVTVNLESEDTDIATVAPARLTFTTGNWNTAQGVTVTGVADVIDNPNDRRRVDITHTVSAASTDYASETAGNVTVTVTDDDAAPGGITLALDTNGATAGTPDTVAEGAGATEVTVSATVDGATRYAGAQTVTVSVGGGTAAAPADYAAVADFTITIAAGGAGHSETFTITPVDDALDEPDETVNVTGTSGSITVTPDVLTITDNDAPPSFSIAAAAADEGEAVVFTVARAGATANVATVKVATAADPDEDAEAAAASDYTAINPAQTLSFGAGDTSKTVSVATVEDDLFEPDETFLAVLSMPALGPGDPGTGVSIAADGGSARGTIRDDDVQPSFSIADAGATEGTAITFTVTRSGAGDNAVSVKWNTKADTGAGAAASTDYTASTTPAQLDFAGGVTAVTFTVATTEDLLDEGNETFLVELTDAEGATITTAEATGTITDDDAAPTAVTLTVDADTGTDNVQDSIAEDGGAKTARITATITSATRFATAQDVTVTIGKAADSATEGTDYDEVDDLVITLPAGADSAHVDVTLTPKQDTLAEGDETLSIEGKLSGVTVTPASLTLTDDEATPTATLVLTPATIDESGAGNRSTVTATLSGASSQALTLTVAVPGGAPVSQSGTVLTIVAGATESTGAVTLTAVDNDVDAVDATVAVSATASGGHGVVAPDPVTLTVEDDDTRGITVSAALDGVTVAEADDPVTTGTTENEATYTVALDSQPTGTVTVNLESEDTDIATVAPARLTFTTGNWNTAQGVTVTGVADIIDNANNRRRVDITHTVSAASTDYASETAGNVTVTVTDDDAAPGGITLALDTNGAADGMPDTVAEGAGATVVTVSATVDGATRYAGAQTVTVSVGGGTAAAPADYAAVADFTITIAAGGAGHSETFTLTPVDDALDEPDETVNVTGTSGSITVTPDVLTITDNDAPPSFSIAAAAADEGAPVVFTVTRAGATANVATVKVATAADTDEDAEAAAASDYTAISPAQTLSFGAGDTSRTVSVATVEDDLFEPDETFLAVLSMPALGPGDPGTGVSIAAAGGSATGTIRDDDVQPSFSIADAGATEGTAITFTVTRSGARDNAVSVKWNTKADTGAGAAASTDYTASTTPAQLDFAGGVTAVTVTVATTEDLLDEGNETFLVELTDAEGATITTAEATGTITDDDAAPSAITLTVDADTGADNVQDSIAEDGGTKTARITATITSATRFAAAQDVTVTIGKAADSATEGTDYDEVDDLVITLPVGAASAHVDVTLTPKQDTLAEPDETLSIEGKLSGVTVTPASLTLTDDEATPTATLVLDPATIDESGAGNRSTVTATLSGASSQAVTLTVAVPGGAPVSQSGTVLTIVAGATESTGPVTLTAVDNDVDAVDATVAVSATASGGHGVAAPDPVTLTVEDDDTRGITVSAALTGVTVAEADDPVTTGATENEATYTVVLDSQPTGPVTVNIESEDTDIATVAPARLTFTTGNWNTAQGVTVTGVADIIDNANDRRTTDITHTVSAADTDYASETASPVTVTVTDDDAAPAGITLALDTNGTAAGTPDTVAEGAGATVVTVRATVDGATRYAQAQTVTVSVTDGTATSPADYAAVADFTITIAAGGAGHSETFTITPVDDAFDEPDETVNVTGASGSITVTPDVLTITDNDDPPGAVTLTVDADTGTANVQASLAEDGGVKTVRVTATLTGATRFEAARTVTVKVGKAADSAAEGTDYTAVADQAITIAANAASGHVDFPLTPTDDAIDETDETLSIEGALSGVTVTPTSLTLTDDEATPTATLVLTPDTIDESGAGNRSTVTATLSGASSQAVTLTVSAAPVAPALAADYTLSGTTLSIAAGSLSSTGMVTITAVDNAVDAADKTVTASATATGGHGVTAPASQTLTIEDDDTATLAIADARADEGATVTFAVTLSTPSAEDVTVTATTSIEDGDSASAADYTHKSQALTIAAGDRAAEFAVTSTDDALDEADETFTVTLSAASVTITGATATGTIVDTDDLPVLSIKNVLLGYEGDEGVTNLTHRVTLSPASGRTVTVKYADTGTGTATSGEGGDYATLSSGTLSFAPGETSKFIRIKANGDTDYEPDETIILRLSEPVNATLSGGKNTLDATGWIENDDASPAPTINPGDTTVEEGETAIFTLSRKHVFEEITVFYGTSPGSADTATNDAATSGSDYTAYAADSTAVFREGEDEITLEFETVDDDLHEAPEDFTVTIGSGDYSVDYTVTISDNDDLPTATLALASSSISEKGGRSRVTASLDLPTSRELRLAVSTTPTDPAVAGDIEQTGQWLTIPAGTRTSTGVVALTGVDNNVDAPDKTITVSALLFGNSDIDDPGDQTLTVTDDDAAPGGITLTVDTNGTAAGTPDTVAEGAGATEVTVSATVDGATRYAGAQTVTVSVDDGTAVAPADYAAVADFTITIAAGGAGHSETFTITPVDDALDEPDETVNVTGTSGSITVTPDVLTITDNDAPPSFSIAAAAADEGAPVVFTVTRAGATANVATVKVATAADPDEDAEAAAASDYTAISPAQTLSFGAGDTSRTVSVATVEDDLFEPDETFLAVLSMPALGPGDPGTGVSIAADGGSARGTIRDDDVQPSFSIADAGATEGTAITFTVTRSGAGDNAVSVKWNTKADTGAGAAALTDYTAFTTPAQLDFAGGVTAVTVTVATTDDQLDEGAETFLVELTDADGATITTAEATGTITDDDAAPSAITLTVDADTGADNVQDSIAEDGGTKTARITATITSATRFATAQDVTVTIGKAADSATEGTDYDEVDDLVITLPVGAASAHVDVTLTPKQDTLDEPDETLSIEGELSGVTVTPASLTLTDDEATPTATLVLTPDTIDESGADNRSTVTATLSGASSQAVTLTVAVPGGAPVSQSGTVLTIVAGATESTGAVTLTAVDNDVDAVDATVAVSATASGGHGVAAPDPVTLTVEDDDERGITVSAAVAGVTVDEADDPETMEDAENEATYTVVLDSQPTGTVTVNLESEDTDIATVAPARLTFTTGNWNTAQGVTVTGVADVIDNPNDRRTTDITHTVSASGTDYAAETADPVTVTVTDDDAAPGGVTLTLDTNGATAGTPDTVAEGAGATVVTVSATVDGATRYAGAQTVTVSVTDGTATAPTDYAAVANFDITIPANAAGHTGTFTLTPVDDAFDEPDETVNVTGASGSITVTPDVLTITDNDAAPGAVTLTVDADTTAANVQDSLAEDGGVKTVRVTATLTGATRFEAARTVTVKVGKAADSAAEGTDYTAVADQAITIAANAASGHVDFPLTPTDDAIDEVDETLSIEGALSGVTVTPTSLTLTDDDTRGITVSAALTGVTVAEADDPVTTNTTENEATYTVALDSQPTGPVTVNLESEDTDVATVAPARLTFTTGNWSTAQGVTVTGVADIIDNANDRRTTDITHTVSAASTDYAGETASPVTVTVTDDDAAPVGITLTLDTNGAAAGTPDTVAEGAGATEVTVSATVDGATRYAQAQTVTVSVDDGTAVAPADYAAVADFTITIAAGATGHSETFTLTPADDAFDEPDETVNVTGASGSITVTPAVLTITDNDDPPTAVTLTVDADTGTANVQASLAEGGGVKTVRVTATLTGATRFEAARTVTVKVGKAADSAAEGTDYTAVADQAITIAATAASGHVDFPLTPTDDAVDEVDETLSIEGALSGVTVTPTSLTLTDDDTRGITVSAALAGVTVDEADNAATPDTTENEATYTVVLDSAPTGTVSISLESEDTDVATVAPASLTFDDEDWNTAQTVTVTAVDDDLDNANNRRSATITHTVSAADTDYVSATAAPVTVTVTDDEGAPTATLVLDPASIDESGAGNRSTVTATLSGASSQALTLTVATAPGTGTVAADYTVTANKVLTIAAGATTSTGMVTITAVDNAVDAPAKTVTVSATATGGNGVAAPASRTLTIEDDDTRGITVSAALTGVTVAEADDPATTDTTENEATYTVVLDSAPTGTVTISLASGDTDVATVAPASLTFDGDDWNTAQTVTVTAVDDDLDNAGNARRATITHTVSAADTDYVSATAAPVTVTVTDDEGAPTATLVLDPATIDESGAANRSTVTATLSGASSQPLTLTVATAPGTGTVAADYTVTADKVLTIAAGATTSTGMVTITAVDNAVDAPAKTVTVSATATGGNGVAAPASRTLTIEDDDTRGITVSAALTGVTVAEADDPLTLNTTENQATYTVVLDSEPTGTGTVTVNLESGDTDTATVAPASLTFDADDWNTAQTVTVTAVDDDLDNANNRRTTDITHTVSAADTDYAGETASPVTVTVTDDDAAPAGITLALDTNGAAAGTPDTVAEGAGATEVTVSATVDGATRYAQAQTVTVSVADGTATTPADYAAVADFTITIPRGATGHSETFTLTPADDAFDEPDETVNVTGASGSITVTPAVLTITDNDDPPTAVTLTVDADTGTANVQASLAEGGGVKTVRVTATLTGATRFEAARTVTVKVGKAADSAAEGTDYTAVADQAITIAANAASGHVDFPLTPTDDAIDEVDETLSIEGALSGVTVTPTSLTLTDDDTRGITVSAALDGVTVAEADDPLTLNTTENQATYTVVLDSAPTGTVSISLASGDTDVATVAPARLTFTTGNWNTAQGVTVTGVADIIDNANDRRTTDITHTVSAADTDYAAETADPVTVTVTDDDAAPAGITLTVDTNGATAGTPDTVAEGAGATVVTVRATVDGATRYAGAQTVTVSVTDGTATAPTDYAAVANFDITIPANAAGHTGTFTITPVDDAFDEPDETVNVTGASGSITVTPDVLTITDNDAAPGAVTLTVDADTGTAGTQTSVAENGGAKTVRVTATLGGATRFPAATTVTVTVGKAADSAAEGTDYTTVANQTLTIAANAASGSVDFTLTPTDDAIDETDETLSIEGALSGVTVTPTSLTLTDDDTRGITVSAALTGVTVAEADDPVTTGATENEATYTVVLDSQPTGTVSISLASGDTDVATVAPASLTFDDEDWNTAQTVTVTAVDDDLDNANNRRTTTITHTVSAADTDYVSATAAPVTVTVTDDEGAPTATLVLDPASIDESGAGNRSTVTATLSGASSQAVTLTVATAPGAGTVAADYTVTANKVLTIAAGATTSTGMVTITAVDNDVDAPDKTVTVSGTASGGGVANPAAVTLTIKDDDTDDDTPGDIYLVAIPTSLPEDSPPDVVLAIEAFIRGGSTFDTDTTVTVSFGRAGDSAISGTDYEAVPDLDIVIPAGRSFWAESICPRFIDDTLVEGDEKFSITGRAGALSVDGTEVTIIDDETREPTSVTLSVDTDSVSEGAGATQVAVTATVDGDDRFLSARTVMVSVGADDDSATEGADYAAVADFPVTIAARATSGSATFTLTPIDDTDFEGAESIGISGAASDFTVQSSASIEITDNDEPEMSLTLAVDTDTDTVGMQSEIAEGDGAPPVQVTASLSGSDRFQTDRTLTVRVGVDGDSAIEGADYAAIDDFPITFAAGAASGAGTFTLTPVDDTMAEGTEIITVEGRLTGASVDATRLMLTDNDESPNGIVLSASPTSVREDGRQTAVTVTATVPGGTTYAEDTEVTISVGSGTATAGADFSPVGDFTITIPGGVSSGSGHFALSPIDDSDSEGDETVAVTGAAADITVTATAVTIEDDEAPLRGIVLSVPDVAVDEGASASWTVRLSAAPDGPVAVTISGHEGADLSLDTTRLEFDETNWNRARTVTVTAGEDDDAADDTATLAHAASGGGYDSVSANLRVVTDDNDAAAIVLAPDTLDLIEGRSKSYTVTLASEPSDDVGVTLSGHAGTYLRLDRADLTFTPADWNTPQTITVTAEDDGVDGGARRDMKTLTHTGAGGGYDGVAAELDIDVLLDPITISIADAEGPEGSYLEFPVTLSHPSPGDVEVSWATHTEVAKAGHDFTPDGGRLHFAAGEQEKVLRVWAEEDDLNDPNEHFSVDMWNPAGAVLDEPVSMVPLSHHFDLEVATVVDLIQATGTITGPAPDPLVLSIGASDSFVDEGGTAKVRVTATVANELERAIRVPLVYANGTAEDGDYEGEPGLWIRTGRAEGTADVTVFQDEDADDETFTVSLGELRPLEAVAGAESSVELTIRDDDRAEGLSVSAEDATDDVAGLTISVEDASAREGEEDLGFVLRLSRPAPFPVTVRVETRDGTASGDRDYIHLSDEVRFAPGEQMQTFMVWVLDDDIDEGSETLTLQLSNPDPADVTLARASATGTIKNSDPIPGVWLARFGRTLAQQTVDSVSDRMKARREPGFEGSVPMLGINVQARAGAESVETAEDSTAGDPGPDGAGAASRPAGFGQPMAQEGSGTLASDGAFRHAAPGSDPHQFDTGFAAGASVSGYRDETVIVTFGEFLTQALSGASFTRTGELDPAGGTLAWWGRGASSQFAGRDGRLGLDGDIETGTLGVDYARDDWLAGASLAQSFGRGNWSADDGGGGELEASLTSLTPYAAYSVSERLQVWGTAGKGWGTPEACARGG